jgi:hypothetical protein
MRLQKTHNNYTLGLKMAAAMFAEMLDNFETLEASHSRKPKLHNELTP